MASCSDGPAAGAGAAGAGAAGAAGEVGAAGVAAVAGAGLSAGGAGAGVLADGASFFSALGSTLLSQDWKSSTLVSAALVRRIFFM